VRIKLVALRVNLYQKLPLSFNKVGDPRSITFSPCTLYVVHNNRKHTRFASKTRVYNTA